MQEQRDSYVEYIWLDGAQPTQKLRSKTRIIDYTTNPTLKSFPEWGFDGSSTAQAEGHDSDCGLQPVFFCKDPIRGPGNYLVMCEVLTAANEPHPTNQRARLRQVIEATAKHEPLIGFEQEYTLFAGRNPLGWPDEGYPAPQGPFYCGVGASRVYGRKIIEAHMQACSQAGLALYGVNAEVMPGQWEFQVGYRGRSNEAADPLTIADHLWLGRYLLERIAEDHHVQVSFENKPIKGDWNGAGMHTNFSTKEMRSPETGKQAIDKAIKNLADKHRLHIESYGAGLADRLTGEHETCSIDEFRSGVSDRGASIRIPMSTNQAGCGYIEDRRPGANADPYMVSMRLLSTICEV